MCIYHQTILSPILKSCKVLLFQCTFFIVVLVILPGITDAQCTDGVELMVGHQLIFDGTTLYRPVGDSFVVSCRKCTGSRRLNWFDENGNTIPNCDNANMTCTKGNDRNGLDLVVSSVTKSLAGTYSCSRRENGTITISVLG